MLFGTNNERKTVLQLVTEEGYSENLQNANKKKLTTWEKNNKFLLGTDNKGRTVWLVAGENGFLEVLQKVWFWAKEKVRNRLYN